jgi:hypothetical protein
MYINFHLGAFSFQAFSIQAFSFQKLLIKRKVREPGMIHCLTSESSSEPSYYFARPRCLLRVCWDRAVAVAIGQVVTSHKLVNSLTKTLATNTHTHTNSFGCMQQHTAHHCETSTYYDLMTFKLVSTNLSTD